MLWLIWLAGIAALCALGWLAGAFLFRWPHAGRTASALLLPAAANGVATWLLFFRDAFERVPASVEAAGWNVIFVAVIIGWGFAGACAALPVWFLLEGKWGWKAR